MHEHQKAMRLGVKGGVWPHFMQDFPSFGPDLNGGASLTTVLWTRVLAVLVGHLVGQWDCVPSHPFLKGGTPHVLCMLTVLGHYT